MMGKATLLVPPPRDLSIDPSVRQVGARSRALAGVRNVRRDVCRKAERIAHQRIRSGETDAAAAALLEGKGNAAFRGLILGEAPHAVAANSPVHPLAPPTVSGNQITVDMMLNQPTRVTRMILDLSLQRFVADRIFGNGGSVSGGAVVYDMAEINELYANRDVQLIEPGAEFPVIETERRGPRVAPVEKWGGKVWIPDEARDRNQTVLFTNKIRQLTNTVIRKINQRAIEVLNAVFVAYPSQTGAGNDWSTVIVGGSAQSNADEFPVADIVLSQAQAEEDELGVQYDLLLLNPQEYAQLVIIYGSADLRSLLAELGLEVYVSNRVTPGTAIICASGQVGEMRVEKPLGSETWREPGRERTWVQSSVRPVMFANNPYAVRQITGLAG